jgi:PAS domain S-box-containing protein
MVKYLFLKEFYISNRVAAYSRVQYTPRQTLPRAPTSQGRSSDTVRAFHQGVDVNESGKDESVLLRGNALALLGAASREPATWAPSAVFLKWGAALVLAGAIIFDALLFIYTPEQTTRAIAVMAIMLVAAVAWMLVVRGKVRMAVVALAAGGWCYITIVSIFFGGLGSTSAYMYPLTILLTGWLIGTRAAMVVAALTAAATFAFMLAEAWGMLPVAPVSHPAMRWVVQCCAFIITAVMISYVVRSYDERIEEIHRLGSDLARRTSALQAIEADLNRAQSVAHVGSWVYDLPADRMTLSVETCRIFGLRKRNTGSYRSYSLRVHPEDRAATDSTWQEALRRGASFDSEHRIVIGRTVRWVRQRAEFAFDAEGRPVRAVGTTQDITARKQAELERAALEAQLRESQKLEALGTLAGGIAHDFNNVLAAITGNVARAREDAGPGHAAQQSLDEIDRAAKRAQGLVQQILMFGRRQSVQRKRMALAPVLEESMRLLRATQPAGVAMTLDCASDAPQVMADNSQIAQVVVNLVTNAWHAVESGAQPGMIDIRLHGHAHSADEPPADGVFRLRRMPPGRYACLAVRDNGTGMDEATQRRIFEPFFTTKEVGKGTGLGLAVVHGIAQGHDAHITVNSRAGQGAEVRVYFPAAAEESAREQQAYAARDANGERDPAAARGRHILYLDDDDALVFLITRLLQRRGYQVSGHTHPAEALAAVRMDPACFDLVVTDYNMPGSSGLAVAQELKAIRGDLPVAMVSGYLTDDLRAKALAAGVRELIYKPNTVEELCDAVARLVSI